VLSPPSTAVSRPSCGPIEFYRRRGLIGALRASNAFGGVITSLASVSLLFEQLVTPFWLSHAVVLVTLVCRFGSRSAPRRSSPAGDTESNCEHRGGLGRHRQLRGVS
jgi:hypothetical protein